MKSKQWTCAILVAWLAVILVGCTPGAGTAPDQDKDTVTQAQVPSMDRSGNPITLPKNVSSIVSLAPSTTRTLLDYGQKDKLIGVDTYSATTLDLGMLPAFDMIQPDTEQLAALDPDLVFVSGMASSMGINPYQPLLDAGICVVDIPSPESIEGMYQDMEFIAACVGAKDVYQSMRQETKQALDSIAAIGSQIKEKKTVLFEISCAPDIYTVGQGTFIQEMLDIIGAENIFHDQQGYFSVSQEAVLGKNPDVILTSVNYIADPVAEVLGRDGWGGVTAISDRNVHQVDSDAVSQPNFHIVEAVKQMAKAVYPQEFADDSAHTSP